MFLRTSLRHYFPPFIPDAVCCPCGPVVGFLPTRHRDDDSAGADSVGILIVLRCKGKEYTILVNQPKVAIASEAFPELPAGTRMGHIHTLTPAVEDAGLFLLASVVFEAQISFI